MPRLSALVLVLAFLVPAAQAQRPDTAVLMADLRYLADDAREGRTPETPGHRQARAYIEARFRALGLAALPAAPGLAGSAYVRPFTFLDRRDSSSVVGANVVGMVRGTAVPDSFLVVTAHYDHVGVRGGAIYNGADDNASGVAGLMAAAAHFAAHPPRHSVVFAALDAEERGLRGARAFVAEASVDGAAVPLARIRVNVNLDMIGRADRDEIYVAGTTATPTLRPLVAEATAPVRGLAVRFGHDTPGTGSDDWTMQSDHGVFHGAGVPFLYFGVEDHPDYHQPGDDADKITAARLGATTEAVVRTLLRLDRGW